MANDNFIFITKEDFQNLGLTNYVIEQVTKNINMESQTLKDIYQLSENLKNLMSLVMIESQSKNNKVHYSYSYQYIRKNNFKQISLAGVLFVFKIRQFLLQESIFFSLGVTDEFRTLYQRKFSQDDLFANASMLRSSLSQKAILFQSHLEKFKQDNDNQEKVGNLNLWPQIYKLAFEGPRIKNSGNDISLNDTEYYQKDSVDKNVYIRYSEGKAQIRNYYYSKNSHFMYFNAGWLYEWYMEYITSSEFAEEKLQKQLQNHTIGVLIQPVDRVEGYKGGDYIDQITMSQVQAKFGNKKMISFVSIKKVLDEISIILSQLLSQEKNIQEIEKKVEELFTDPSIISGLNKDYSTIISQQLELLNNFK